MKTPSLFVAVAVSAATLSAAPTRTCLFTPTGGAPRDLVIADWSATVNGAPHELVVGEHRCGFHRFRDGWTFPGFDPRQRNESEVLPQGTLKAIFEQAGIPKPKREVWLTDQRGFISVL